MIAIMESNRPGFKGILIDSNKKHVIADLKKLTDGWTIGKIYKQKNGIRCKTWRIEQVFTDWDNLTDLDKNNPLGGGDPGETTTYDTPPAAPSNMAAKYNVATRFEFMEELTSMVIKETTPAAIITGPGGIGKTFTVLKEIEKSGIKREEFTMIKGFTTPMGLYMTLHDNRHSLIVFDDCDSAFRDPTALNLLKGALDSTDRRIISWNSTRIPDGIESPFEFEGRIIFISNIPLRGFDNTLISRSFIIDLQMSREEIVEHVDKIKSHIAPATKEEQNDTMQFMKDKMDMMSDFNIRTYLKILRIRLNCKDQSKWRSMAEFMLCS